MQSLHEHPLSQIEKTKKKECDKSSQSHVIRKSYLIIQGRPQNHVLNGKFKIKLLFHGRPRGH